MVYWYVQQLLLLINIEIYYRDPNEAKRTASHISWFPDGPRKLAIAYCNMDFQGSAPDTSMDSYIWDIGKRNFSPKWH